MWSEIVSPSAGEEPMSAAESSTDRSPTVDIDEISQDAVFEVLSNQRRRFVIHHLKHHDGESATVSELAERVAGWENDKPVEALTHKERKRVRNALRQFHLPKMADYGFVEYDVDRGTVSLTAATASTEFYVDALTGRDVPWGVYYVACSAVSAVCLLGLWLEIYPFTLLSPLVYGTFVVTFFIMSSVGHLYDNQYRMRLGARSTPLEVDID
jgi:hypothetical protein